MNYEDRYPIGQQNFKILREEDAYYVDKTAQRPAPLKITSSNLIRSLNPGSLGETLYDIVII